MEGEKENSGFLCLRPIESDDSDVDDFGRSYIFVRGVSLKKLEMRGYHEVGEFFLIDFNKCRNGQVLKPYCGTLINTTHIGGIFDLDSKIFISSLEVGKKSINDILNRQNPINDIIDSQGYHRLSGLSFVDLDKGSEELEWNLASPPIGVDNMALSCCVLNDSIYCLPSYHLSEALVYRAWGDCWYYSNPPPSHLSKCLVSGKLIPDRLHNRILVHLSDGGLTEPSLYAWYPEGRDDGPTWELITPFSTRSWRKKVVLVSDVLFMYFRKTPDLFQAFDMKSKRLLNIEWREYYPGNLARARAVSMSSTGGTQLTLTCYNRFISDIDNTMTGSSIFFIRYHFERVSSDTIVFSYDLTKHFKLLNIKRVTHSICLDD